MTLAAPRLQAFQRGSGCVLNRLSVFCRRTSPARSREAQNLPATAINEVFGLLVTQLAFNLICEGAATWFPVPMPPDAMLILPGLALA
jgi:small neutral amino acid transporter SnatA (MarC family)